MGRNGRGTVLPCTQRTCKLSVLVARSDGQPLSAAVTVTLRGPQQRSQATSLGGVIAFELGSFGTYRVSVTPGGDEANATIADPHPAEIKLGRGDVKSLAFTLTPRSNVKIKVSRLDNGALVRGAVVSIAPLVAGPAPQDRTTDRDGLATFAPLPAGDYRVTVASKQIDGRSFATPKPEYRLTLLAGKDKVGHLRMVAKIHVINLMDHGSTGTGHQASMLALLDSIVAYKFDGEVHLTYYRWKTRYWCEKLGVALPDGATAFARHTAQWTANYRGLTVTCHPIGAGPGEYDNLLKQYRAAANPGAHAEETFWSNVFWTTAAGGPATDFARPTAFSTKKFVAGTFTLRAETDGRITQWGVGEYSSAVGEALLAPPVVHTASDPAASETLTMFAAFDSPSVGLLDPVKTMTGEDRPWTVILQPFLWANTDHASAQVLHAADVSKDLQADLAGQQLVPVFPKQIPDPADIDGFVESRDPAAANKAVVKKLLTAARARSVQLISAYYTQASAVDVPYARLLVVLVAALQHVDLRADDRPVVLALLGGESPRAHEDAFAGADALPDSLRLMTPDLLDDLPALRGKIVLMHVGRSGAMALFERHSLCFVSEGANTWQETLSTGMPTLSARPTGETRPWIHPLGVPAGADAVRLASEAIVALARSGLTGDALRSAPEMPALVGFLRSVRDEPAGDARRDFQAWSEALKNPKGDQFLAAIEHLREHDVHLRTR